MNKFTFAQALFQTSKFNTEYVRLLEKDMFDLGFYQPTGHDLQTPHPRDEIYFIASGSGEFVCGNETQSFSSGDVFFVSSGVEHKFLNFSKDFAAWVVFFNPKTKL